MGDVTVKEAIERLRSERLKDRIEGVADLRHIFSQNRRGTALYVSQIPPSHVPQLREPSSRNVLHDKGYHKIYEALFRVVAIEKATYLKASTAKSKSQSSSRLSSCASTLRTAVEAGVSKIRQKTVKALIDHVVQVLPTVHERLCEPLSLDYLKSLRSVLQFQAHIEHLSQEEWRNLVDFCIDGVKIYDDSLQSSPQTGLQVTSTPNGSAGKGSGLQRDLRLPTNNGGSNLHVKGNTEELVLCLEQLVATPNAPILDKAQLILAALIQFLQENLSVGRSHQAALAAINSLLARIITDSISLSRQVVAALLPLLKRLWGTKSASLKDEILVTFMLSQTYIEALLLGEEADKTRSNLESLLEAFQEDYCRRLERDQLQLDDIELTSNKRNRAVGNVLSLRAFALLSTTPRLEQAWSILHVTALLSSFLDYNSMWASRKDGEEINPKKRRRVTRSFDEMVRHITASNLPNRLCALQTLSFILEQVFLDVGQLKTLLTDLSHCVSDENMVIASWSMLALSSCAFQKNSQNPALASQWVHVWHMASRNVSSPSTCRAACHLLEMILTLRLAGFSSITDTVENMISSLHINGPSTLVDSAISFLSNLTEIRSMENPGSASTTSDKVLHWLFSKWNPARASERSVVQQYARHAVPHAILDILWTCCGRSVKRPKQDLVPAYGCIGAALRDHRRKEELLRYLLLLEDPERSSVELATFHAAGETFQSSMTYSSIENTILRFCRTELDQAKQKWTALINGSKSNLNPAMIQVLISLCAIGADIASQLSALPKPRREDQWKCIDDLMALLHTALSRDYSDQALVDAALETICTLLPPQDGFEQLYKDSGGEGVLKLAKCLISSLERRAANSRGSLQEDENEMIDVDETVGSQGNSISRSTLTSLSRRKIIAQGSASSFRYTTSARLYQTGAMASALGHLSSEMSTMTALDYLSSLEQPELIGCQYFFQNAKCWLSSMTRTDADRLLLHLGTQLLQRYEYERCEISMSICLNVLQGFAPLLSQHNLSDELFDRSLELYAWFINVVLERNISSPDVQMDIAELLIQFLKLRSDFPRERSLPSARTSLLKLLQDGDTLVKFQIMRFIPEMFHFFTLDQHDTIYEDVLSSLPSDADWEAGIALRLLMLARLASQWYTLLRRCVYHIFETPEPIPEAAKHAKRCLSDLSRALKLDRPQHLLKLFLSQILHTWLEDHPLQSIPFSIFGYESSANLLEDVRDEAVAQLIMRSEDDQVAGLARLLGSSMEDLILTSFDRTLAYSVARDISMPPVQSGEDYVSGESRVRNIIGKERFLAIINSKFSEIISLFFRSIEQGEQIERAFTKHPSFVYALKTLERIKAFGSSDHTLPPSQQPSFRARYLIDEIRHLCHRTGFEMTEIWTPSLLVFISRFLFDSIHPALGALHACSVIRKLRILICIAGEAAFQGYPLEMLLHRIRPFLTDFHCADDALGIFRYLLEAGKEYLSQVPSFLAELGLSTLVSLRTFLDSPQQGTTQESEYVTTMSKGREFHRWFGEYVESYDSAYLSGSEETTFRAILQSASNTQARGNASSGTSESIMLRTLLKEESSPKSLLTNPSRSLAFALLCADFTMPEDFRDDIFASSEEACENAAAIWKSCQRPNLDKAYLAWASRVLGRAYGSTGQVHPDILRESALDDLKQNSQRRTCLDSGSKSAILRSLIDLLHSGAREEVSLAESALQLILSRVTEPDDVLVLEQVLPESLIVALKWPYVPTPEIRLAYPERLPLEGIVDRLRGLRKDKWVQALAICLAYAAVDDPILGALAPVLAGVMGLAEQSLPYILHMVCVRDMQGKQDLRPVLSRLLRYWFHECDTSTIFHVKILLNAILYLRSQPIPHEAKKADREHWLDLDYEEIAIAASRCKMFKTALLFIEIQASQATATSRRSSNVKFVEPSELLSEIFQNIDEPDSFYGVQQQPSLESTMKKLEYEKVGYKSLSYRGALFDSQMRHTDNNNTSANGLIMSLQNLGLSGLSYSLLQNQQGLQSAPDSMDRFYQSARKLEQWDLPAPITHQSNEASIYRAFQCMNNKSDRGILRNKLNVEMENIMGGLIRESQTGSSLQSSLRTLAILNEVDETVASQSFEDVEECWERMILRQRWMYTGRFEDVNQIWSARETLFSCLSRRTHLREMVRSSPQEIRQIEVRSLLESSRMSRVHEALQYSLNTTTFLSHLIEPCDEVGLKIAAAASFEAAQVLWAQGEMTPSIRILQHLKDETDFREQAAFLGQAELLATLGHQVSEARLEKPEAIISLYLSPAIKGLRQKGAFEGSEAGKVYHEFASFCDQQLQDTDNLEDFHRVRRLRERKEMEVRDLEKMIKSAGSQGRSNLQLHRARAKQWYDLDNREFQRLYESRKSFLVNSIENYLLCLSACESYNTDVLRFCALWLEQPDNETAELVNGAVSKYLSKVPSRKFAPLMNQLSSRLSDVKDEFQPLLFYLVHRICVDHPYHGMHHIFSTSKSKGKDEMAVSRHSAALKMVSSLKNDDDASETWLAVHNTNICYAKLALEKLEEKIKPGSKIPLRKSSAGQRLEHEITTSKVPPPTMRIALRADCDYSTIPTVSTFLPEITVAGGVSVPKIVTAIASDGIKYKQLVKGGNDDLRQDAIMEQVFEQVSELLQNDRFTRQRNLQIRTYKVLPLTTNAGIIEFVSSTVPLHDFLMPAHQKHFPKDWKPHACRRSIGDVQTRPIDVRLKTYRQVVEHFHPVMRFFFMERFETPDDWFEKRLAYVRSTAAISILGHVLGLGDRHGHNILLDEKTGDVVHIDLGVAFEQGRVLPVPEVVPFRLTRDIVDGMGITRTDGVFRRCCEFTLDALRKESYSITTILDVLRYDPLYSWTVSPLRVKKIQEQQNEVPDASTTGAEAANASRQRRADEPSEADRALTVVAKKLSKTLSVTATVNELIQQATDEKNLAVLYCGWAAYA
ncbi:MAG: Serine/threonine-protein kinase tel1 [Sclerophora amabilis]|nr:MAG: Serine/threonine-protein kinase tel1 [Sclerophora amabilis]